MSKHSRSKTVWRVVLAVAPAPVLGAFVGGGSV